MSDATKDTMKFVTALRDIVLKRWMDTSILDHVSVKLPAPIFDHLSADLAAEHRTVFFRSRRLDARRR